MKLRPFLVPRGTYPTLRKNVGLWKSEFDKLKSKDINKCVLCSPLDHGLNTPLFQKACEGVILAHKIGQARQILEGSLEGDYLSENSDFDLVEDLKNEYFGKFHII